MAVGGLKNGRAAASSLALLIAGSCGGFLIYNFNPAKLFMGDCGSLQLGFLMSATALAAGAHHAGGAPAASHLLIPLFLPVTLLALPAFHPTLSSALRPL